MIEIANLVVSWTKNLINNWKNRETSTQKTHLDQISTNKYFRKTLRPLYNRLFCSEVNLIWNNSKLWTYFDIHPEASDFVQILYIPGELKNEEFSNLKNLKNVTKLFISEEYLPRCSFPKLEDLTVFCEAENRHEKMIEFLQKHPSIKNLDCQNVQNDTLQWGNCLPFLRKITLDRVEDLNSLFAPLSNGDILIKLSDTWQNTFCWITIRQMSFWSFW